MCFFGNTPVHLVKRFTRVPEKAHQQLLTVGRPVNGFTEFVLQIMPFKCIFRVAELNLF